MSDQQKLSEDLANKIQNIDINDDKAREDLLQAVMGYHPITTSKQTPDQIKKKLEEAQEKHKFWNTQPVPKLTEVPADQGPIDAIKTIDDIPAEPLELLSQFEWTNIDFNDPKELEETYQLLCNHYVEDDDNMFRFDYSKEFLRWACMPPGWRPEWHCGVRVKSNKKLVACITAIPVEMSVYSQPTKMVEINFLCVHKKLRSKRLTPLLIKEITRRVNRTDCWQAAYTAGVVLPKPVSRTRYYHRSLNPKKLIDIGFSRLQPNMTMARTIKLYRVPADVENGVRPMAESDVDSMHALLSNFLSQFHLHPIYSKEDVKHWFLSQPDVIDTYVKADPATGAVTDMFSFYTLPSTVIGHPRHNNLKAAYSFYNIANTMPSQELMNDALIVAKQKNYDVFNALNVMNNDAWLKSLKFGPGDGNLQYYLYNWRCPEIEPKDLGLVLL